MAWKYDMNGKRVWFDDGVIGTRGTGETLEESRRREEGTAGMIRRKALETVADAVRPGIAFTGYKDPWTNDAIVGEAPFKPTPAPAPAAAGTSAFVPTPAPTRLPPETVEATRLPPERPMIEATVMRRGAPGSGEFGENADLTPGSVRRFTPMSRADAEMNGMIYDPGAAQREADRQTNFSRVIADRRGILQRDASASMEMTSPAARRMRAGFDAVGEAGRRSAAVRATGRAGGSRDIVASILGEQREDAASGRRMQEARVTPVGSGDTVYDPLTGKAHTAPAKGPVKPQEWDEYAPEDLEGMINRTVKSILPADDEKAMYAALGEAQTPEEKAEVIQKFTRSATPEQRLVLDNAYEALRRKSIAGAGTAGGAGGAGVYKPGMFGKK